MVENIAKFELNNKVDKDGDSEFERKMEELISVILDEQYELYREMNFNSFLINNGKMMPKILLTFILLLNVALYANEVPYKIDVIRNGKVHHQVAYNFWSGEYPSPVINVHAGTDGKTTIEGYVSLRDKKERKVCTIKNGLYHPWAKGEDSLINFYTITAVESYEIIATPSSELQQELSMADPKEFLQVGDKILNVVYNAEGISQGTIHGDKRADEIVYFQVNIFENNPKIFQRIENISTLEKNEQWLYLKCDEGYNIFVEDVDLLEQEGIKKGHITGYGSVSS